VTTENAGPGPVTSVRITAAAPGGTNPRKVFEKTALDELRTSIIEHGVLQPLLLRPWPEGQRIPKGVKNVGPVAFEIVAGERRWRAAQAAGLEEIPALVRELTDDQVLEIQVVENLQRQDLHPLEEADGYRRLVASNYDVKMIAEKVGRSVAYVYDRLKLADLIDGARELFLAGKIQAGHAIVLARLAPEDQKRAIVTDGALFEDEHTLFDPTVIAETEESRFEALPADLLDKKGDGGPDLARSKTRTVRELQAWIDKHVKFDAHDADPMLFPETVAAVQQSAEEELKVVQITHEHFVQPCAKDGSRIYGPSTWRPAEPPCERQVTGVIVVGPGRGQSLPVCIDKKGCDVHWRDAIRARKKAEKAATKSGKTGVDKYELQRQQQELQYKREAAERERWLKAVPEILAAIAAAVKKAPATANGLLSEVLVACFDRGVGRAKKAGTFLPRGKSAEDLVRHLAFLALCEEAGDTWSGPRNFPKRAKALGFDVKAIVDKVAPPAAEEKPAPAKKAKRGKAA
jgi:ParB/RepB/Spo0J family partition protein